MFRHELSLIGIGRIMALAAAMVFASLATISGIRTQHFTAEAHHVTGRVLESQVGGTNVQFRTQDGEVMQRPVRGASAGSQGDVPILYTSRGGTFDVRLDRAHDLWAPMWRWIEWSVAALLVAIYGRALVENPLSVIGFKGWRLRGRG